MSEAAPSWSRVTQSAEETIQAGRELGARLTAPVVVMIHGELGAGKTTFCKGVIGRLGAAREEDVTSPTFTLVHEFRGAFPSRSLGTNGAARMRKVYHVDLYRVSNVHDLETLGLDDILSESAVILVEWPERLTLRTDWPIVHVRLEFLEGDKRRIELTGAPAAM